MTHAVNATDRGALLSTISLTLLTYSFSSWLLRVYLRLRVYGPWGRDDTAATTATLFAVLQVIGTCVAVSFGFGKQSRLIDNVALVAVEKATYGVWLLYFAAICCSRCSSYLLVARLAREGHIFKAAQTLTLLSITWGIVSIFLFAFSPYQSDKWGQLFPRWLGVEITSILLELALLGLAVWLVWGHRMTLAMKATVVGTLGARSLIIPAVIYRLFVLSNPPTDPTFASVDPTIMLQCILHYSVIAATIPTAKSIIRPFQSGWSDMRAQNLSYGTTHVPKTRAPPSSPSPIALASIARSFLPSALDFEQRFNQSKKTSTLSWQGTQSSQGTSSSSVPSRAFTMAEVGEADELFRPDTIGFTAVAEFGKNAKQHGSLPSEGSMIIKRTMSLDIIFEKVTPGPQERKTREALIRSQSGHGPSGEDSCLNMPELAPWPCENTNTTVKSKSKSSLVTS